MDEETYNKRFMILTLKKHEKRFNSILTMMADYLREEVRKLPKEVQCSLYNSMLLMVFINAIATTMARISEDEFEEALHDVIKSIIDACDELRERFSL